MPPVLVFGASYGSLFATQLLLAGIIERVDRFVQAAAAPKDTRVPGLDALVALVDARLDANRRRAGAA